MGVDREDFSDADPIAFDARADRFQPQSVKQREWFEDLVPRAGP
jgi:hypothetical protein